MPNPIATRKDSKLKAISTAPSFNKTPVGSATPPLPYPTIQDLSNSSAVVPTVKFNGDPAYVLQQTIQPSCKGDSPGALKGVKSNTVGGEVKPTGSSTTVNAGKKRVVRQGDTCTMNGGNNPGIYQAVPVHSGEPPAKKAKVAEPETKEEKSFWKDMWEGAKEHSGEEIEAEVYGGPDPLPYKKGDSFGKVMGRALSQMATDMHEDAIYGGRGGRAPRVKVQPPVAHIKPHATSTPATQRTAQTSGAGGSSGTTIIGSGGNSPCGIKPYKDQKCPAGQQAHHIVPDYALRYGSRGKGAKGIDRIPGMPSLDDGPSICLSGGSKIAGSDHNAAHEGTDPKIKAAGLRTDNGIVGVATLGEILNISTEEVAKVKPQCKDEIKREVDKAFSGVDRDKYVRTTQNPPKKHTEVQGTLSRGDRHGSTPLKRKK